MNTLNFPASALNSGANTITMSVHFSGTNTDSIYTGKVWLTITNNSAAFYASEVLYSELTDTTFCNKNVNFRAEIEGLHPTASDNIMWYIDNVFETSEAAWCKPFENGTYEIKLVVYYHNDT